ncbi:SDR family oxidoreductase [Reichenbachiella carrageenanivorans]|uniref:SDR family oxidoreductase n=1 Tax=Reichenbachiella carrageenanivorans TaxID=2979869 RepID=A0ABY6D2V9_9BACT|nr:SDR family oxidoreductase [Reichenbachiella carrageenanivorans]UXX80453.1 SDR family oxidoreductase [Reichenbachiella carrageenanivorans]
MKTVSILGCGWLGLPLGKHLAKAGYVVKGSTTHASKMAQIEEASIRPYHLTFAPDLEGEAEDFFDSDVLLINLPPRNKDGQADFHQNQLLAIRERIESSHVLFISSTAVYPANDEEVTEADASADCVTRGGIHLLEMERLFSESHDIRTTVIRFGGLYGSDRHPGRFLAGKQGLSGAHNPVNMIHLEDCIGVIRAVIAKDIWGEVFNACAPLQETRQSFYEKAAVALGVAPPSFTDAPAPFKKVNVDKLLRMTNYRFNIERNYWISL